MGSNPTGATNFIKYMTYEDKIQSVISNLEDSGADSEREWAEIILRGIGITPENPNGPPQDKSEILIALIKEKLGVDK